MTRLDEMREDLSANDFADDVGMAKKAVDAHMESRRKVVKIPVENMDNVGQRLLHRLSTNNDNSDSGYGSQRDSVTTNMAYNPDLQAMINSGFFFGTKLLIYHICPSKFAAMLQEEGKIFPFLLTFSPI